MELAEKFGFVMLGVKERVRMIQMLQFNDLSLEVQHEGDFKSDMEFLSLIIMVPTEVILENICMCGMWK